MPGDELIHDAMTLLTSDAKLTAVQILNFKTSLFQIDVVVLLRGAQ